MPGLWSAAEPAPAKEVEEAAKAGGRPVPTSVREQKAGRTGGQDGKVGFGGWPACCLDALPQCGSSGSKRDTLWPSAVLLLLLSHRAGHCVD